MSHKYSLGMRIFHWVFVIALVSLFIVGNIMHDMDPSPEKWELYGMHKASGSLLFILIFARIFVRIKSTIPDYDTPLKKIHHFAANMNFKMLYLLMILMPLSGLTMSLLGGHPVDLFLFTIPALSPGETAIGHLAHTGHWVISYLLMGFVTLHIAGFLFHLIVEKNNLLKRMF